MRLSLRLPVLALVALLAACARGEAPPGRIVESVNPINYYVRVTAPGSDRYQITLAADHLRRDSVDFVLPAWIPGQYATRVPSVAENFAARDGGGSPIPVRRLAVNVWRLYTETTDYVTVDYHIRPGTPVEPLASRIQLDLHGGFAMGGAIFGFLDGIAGRPVTVTFDLPPGWRSTSPLRPAGPNRFAATSYREIPGSPFVIGDRWAEFKLFVQGKPHQIVVQGAPPDFPPDTLLRLVNETIDHATLFFGRPPYERYIFAIHFVSPEESGMGASGQAAGSALFLPPLAGNRMREAGLGSLLLHQYLHAWYPGQFGPVSLMRPEYRFPPRVPDAWLIEGAAEYYARLLPVRHGTMDRQEFYDALADVLWYWRELGGGNRIDLLDLATAGRSGDARESSRLVAGGTLAVFLLDLMIREDTGGLRGVDQVLHFLQRRSGTTGYLEDRVWTEAATVLGLSPAALDLLATQGSIPIEANLARAGLRQVQRDLRRRSLGAVLAPDAAGRFVVNAVERGGTAASAGMREGDRLVKINGTPVAPDEVIATRFALMTYIEEAETGSAVTFEVVRRGQPVELRGTVRALPGTRIAIVEAADATATALQVRNSLFRSSSYATD